MKKPSKSHPQKQRKQKIEKQDLNNISGGNQRLPGERVNVYGDDELPPPPGYLINRPPRKG